MIVTVRIFDGELEVNSIIVDEDNPRHVVDLGTLVPIRDLDITVVAELHGDERESA